MSKHYSGRHDSAGYALYVGEYQRKSGTYEYKYTDHTGMRRTISAKTLDDLREAEQQADKADISGLQYSNVHTVDDLYESWLSMKRGMLTSSLHGYRYTYEHFIRPYLGRYRVTKLKRSDVKRFYNRLHDSGASMNTLHTVQTVLHQMLDAAVEDDIILKNPADKVLHEIAKDKTSKPRRTNHDALTLDEQEAVLSFVHTRYQQWYPPIAVLLHTGLRVGELSALTLDDIDFEEGMHGYLHVRRDLLTYRDMDTHKLVTCIHDQTKTEAGMRDIPLTETAADALHTQALRTASLPPLTVDGRTGFLFRQKTGRLMTEGTIDDALLRSIFPKLNSYRKEQNLPEIHHISAHGFRHTYCTNLCRAGIPLRVIMDLMGHNDADTTLRIYAEATKDMKDSSVISLEDYLDR